MTNETNKQKPHPYSQVLQWVSEGKEIECHQAFNSEWRPTDYDTVLSCAIHGVKSGSYLQPQDFRLKPQRHIHQELIDAYTKGAEIQMYIDCKWEDIEPQWATNRAYRIKPEPKPDIIGYCESLENTEEVYNLALGRITSSHWHGDNIKVVFCGETRKLKSIELLETQND